jgi:hypothetical protein
MVMFAILLAVSSQYYWTVRELILNTFRVASRNKPFIIALAVTGLASAIVLTVTTRLLFGTILPTPLVFFTALLPSRAEITDAAMGERAECVMLNKGPYILTAVRILGDILQRMRPHHERKNSMLRKLHLAVAFHAGVSPCV